MRLLTLTSLLFFLISCGQTQDQQRKQELKKELELVEKKLAEKTKELEDLEEMMAVATDSSEIASLVENSTDEKIQGIRNEFTRINSLSLTKKSIPFVCEIEGTLVFYLENNKIVKAGIDWGFFGDYESTSEYYYKNGKLIFGYEVSIGGPANGPVTKTEQRTYVDNDRTIKYIRNKETVSCTTCQYNQSSREYKILKATSTKTASAVLCN